MGALANLIGAAPRYARLLSSQYWKPEKLQAYRENRIRRTLAAAARIPFYAARFPSSPTLDDFARLPLLKREEINELNKSVRSLYPPGTSLAFDCSSGSSGMPVEVLFDASHQRGRFAARARCLRQNGWNPLQRNAWILSPRMQGTQDGRLIRSHILPGLRFLPIFTGFEEQAAWLRRFNPLFLYTIPSNLEPLLDVFQDRGTGIPALRRIFTGGGMLEENLRRRTRQVLGVDISDNYGTTEAFLAWECPRGSYHVNSEHVHLEIVDEAGHSARPGETGRVLVTTLENCLMPLVRYEIGDYAALAEENCPCGRTLPRLRQIAGRSINLFRLADGRKVSPWEIIWRLKHHLEPRQFQIIQEEMERFRFRFVPCSALTPEDEGRIRKAFSETLGPGLTLEFEQVEEIPRTSSGKYMTALSLIEDRP